MMKCKERGINKRVTIQQHPQQTSTKSFACQKRKKIVYCIFNFLFPFFSYISKPDFLDIFELTARYIVNERTEEKRVLFRNIFLNSLTKKDCSYDKTEKYMRILEQMNSLDLLLLRIFSNPAKYNEQQGEIIKDPNWIRPGVRNMVQFSMVYEVSKMLHDLIKVPQDDISESLYFLEGNRLLVEKTGNYRVETNRHPIRILEDKLTTKGKDFIAFILR